MTAGDRRMRRNDHATALEFRFFGEVEPTFVQGAEVGNDFR